MERQKRFSLAAKISVLAIAVIIATASGISLFTIRMETANYYHELLSHGLAIADATAQNCEYGVFTRDRATLDLVLQGLSADADIAYAMVLGADGQVLAKNVMTSSADIPADLHRDPPAAGRPVHADYESERDGRRYLDILYPVSTGQGGLRDPLLQAAAAASEARIIGYLRLGMAQEQLQQRIRGLVLSTLFFTLVLVVAGSALSIYLSRRITAPLERLQEATRQIARGDFEKQIQVRSSDEIADLADAFDSMRTSLRSYRDRLTHDAFHDALTGLPNRALFVDRLQHAITTAQRRPDFLFAVLFLDLDSFKVINDSLGHTVGDRLLVEFSRKLVTCTRPGDTVARLGGDEFALLLEDISGEGNALHVASRVRGALQEPFTAAGHEVFVTGSMGIALSSAGYGSPEQVLRDADIALNQSKAHSRSSFTVFEQAMHANAVERLVLETDLRKAIERREFVAYYQPILSVTSKRIVGYEALARWYHAERGIVPPASFIPLAEETGLIVSLERSVLRQACLQMRRWLDMFPGQRLRFISVNLAHKQIRQPDLVEVIQEVLRDTGLQPDHLKLEITENVLFEDPEAAVSLLTRLRGLGVQLYIDDFGTGYSSLSYLHRLPIDGLKIDRSFIKRIDDADENRAIIRSIMTLARDMRIEVVAEGVETANQLAHVESLDCTYWQGYFFSPPVKSEDAESQLAG